METTPKKTLWMVKLVQNITQKEIELFSKPLKWIIDKKWWQ